MDRTHDLIEQIQAKASEAERIAEQAEKDGWTTESKDAVKHLLEEVKELKGRLDEHKEADGFAEQLAELSASLGYEPGPAPLPGSYEPARRGQTIGQQFVESSQYKAFVGQWPSGRIPDRARVNMDPVGLKELISITGTAGTQALVPPDLQGLVDLLGRPEFHIRNLVSVRTTSSDLIEYVRQLSRENAADWVPEAKSIDDDDALKPMGGFDFEIAQAPVETVAEWIPITKRAVMDAGQLRGLIDQELRGDLLDAEEQALMYGNGAGIEGLDNTDGVQEQDFDTDIFVTTRKAKSKVIYGGRAQPTAYLLNVEDDEKIDLAKDDIGRFFSAGPFGTGPSTLWGLPRVVSEQVKPGEAWLADWRRAVIWDRQQATISVSDSHADFFIRNLIAVLGEQREAFGVIRPAAFVKIETA